MTDDSTQIQRLKTALDELRVINNLLNNIARIRETNHMMSLIINELVKVTDADQGIINLISRVGKDSLLTVARDRKKEQTGLPFKVDNLISGWVAKHKTMLKIDDLDDDDRFPGISSNDGQYSAIICIPMFVRDEIIGLTSLVRTRQQGPFTEDQCRVAGIIASQSAQILSNAKLLEELAQKNELLELSQQKLNEENVKLRSEVTANYGFENIIGKSPAMKKVLTLISKFCGHDSPALITGQTGTGKELVAKSIHYNSSRRDGPFVVINCGAKTESLLESELFGHVKGSFTGAIRDKIGLFKEADKGTIFLDEIGDASPATQVAILRVIQNGEIRPLGSTKTEIVDVRVISATNKDLNKGIRDGSFREDLFYRLSTFAIEVPPLSQRKDDIPLLINYFLNKLKIKTGKENLMISPEAMDILINFPWPGNIRQLENEIERAAVVCDPDGHIDVKDLSFKLLTSLDVYTDSDSHQVKLSDIIEKFERNLIISALAEYKGNIMQTSKALGLSRKGLRDKMARYKINREQD